MFERGGGFERGGWFEWGGEFERGGGFERKGGGSLTWTGLTLTLGTLYSCKESPGVQAEQGSLSK